MAKGRPRDDTLDKSRTSIPQTIRHNEAGAAAENGLKHF